LRTLEPIRIWLEIDEFQGVGGTELIAESFVFAIVEEIRETGAGIDAKVLAALRANIQVLFKIFFPNDLTAALTLHPQAFGANFLFARGV